MTFVLAAQAATVPTAPTITVGSPQTHSLTLNLTAASSEPVHGLVGYDIELSIDGVTWSPVVSNYTAGFPYVASGLNPGTPYFFRVRGISGADGAYRSLPSATVTGTTSSTGGGGGGPTRRYAGGHYVAWPLPLGANGIPNGGTVTGTYPNAVVTGATASNAGPAVRSSADGRTGNLVVAGFVIRYYWKTIEPTAGTYDYSEPDKHLAQARALGVPVMLMLVVRTFDGNGTAGDGTHPLPADLRAAIPGSPYGYADAFVTGASGSQKSGFQTWRWSPKIRSRYNNIMAKLGARYNADPFFAGVATQETSSGSPTGGSNTTYTVGNYTGMDAYSSAGFALGLNDENDAISNNFPNAMPFPYQNFMQGPFAPGDSAQKTIARYGAYAQPNGSWFGCPDLVTGASGNANIVNNVYPNLALYHSGSAPVPAPGPTFASVQHGEWNGSGVGDTPVSLGNLFNFATSSFKCKPANGFAGALDWSGSAGRSSPLNVDGVVWDYDTSGTPNFATDLVPLMKAFPTFGTWVPPTSGPANKIYIDVNAAPGGSGTSPASPTNIIPTLVQDNTALLFNADNGIQTMPVADNAFVISGNNVLISSYSASGTARAVLSGFEQFTSGWTLVPTTTSVYSRVYNPTPNAVGCVMNMTDFTESPQGTVMKFTNLTNAAAFDPTTLPVGSYAYDWRAGVTTMYINIGANPNTGGHKIGISRIGRFMSVQPASSPTGVEVTNLRFIGAAKSAVNAVQASSNWHIHHNQFYANGGYFVQSTPVYEGTGITVGGNASNVEIDNNLIEQTFDSPTTVQHFGGTTAETIDSVHIHHNTITHWANAAFEISDFGTSNITSNVNVEFNIATGAAQGYSGIGHSTGFTDGFQIRGGPTRTLFGLRCADNTIQGFDGCVSVKNGTATDQLIVLRNRLSSAKYGIYNTQPAVVINAANNSFCNNSISDVQDVNNTPNTAINTSGTYSGNTSSGVQCLTPPIAGQGVQP